MRLRRESPLDPATASELEAIDRAVRGEGADPELESLVFELRSERPVPEREFAVRMDALVRDGFAPVPEQAIPSPHPRKRRRVALAFAGAATVFIAVTAVLSSGVLTRTSSTDSGGSLSKEAPSPQSLDRSGGAAGGLESAPSQAPAPSVAPRAGRREVERDASLKLATTRGQIESVADDAIAITDRYRGFVLSSRVSDGERRASASLELRLPAARLQPALADLSELAHVRSRTQSSQDVTGAVSSLRARLRAALADRRFLLDRLARASTDAEAASLRARVRIANRRIARIRSSFRAQRNRVDYAAVSVAIAADEDAGDHNWTPGDALDDAGGILETSAAIAVVALAILIPLSLLLLLAWGGVRETRRRLREHALDARAPD